MPEGSAADGILQAPTLRENAERPASGAHAAAARPSCSSPAPAATPTAGAAAASLGGGAEVQAAEAGRAAETRPEQREEEAAGKGLVLQPWTDHRGRLNEPFLRSLTQRAVSIVIRCPGRLLLAVLLFQCLISSVETDSQPCVFLQADSRSA